MRMRVKKFLGVFILIGFIAVYSLLVMRVAVDVLPQARGILEFIFYAVAGMAWVYLVKAEYRLRDLAAADAAAGPDFAAVYARWRALAATTFAGVLGIFGLMVFRPGL